VSRKQIIGLLLFEETVTAENYPNPLTHFIALLQRMKGIAGFSKMGRPPILRKQQLFCRTSCVVALSGVAFSHHDRQTLRHLTSFCDDYLYKESRAIIEGAWRKLKRKIEHTVAGETLRKVANITVTRVNACFQGEGHFQKLL
jgi:hypothetical protein